MINVVFSLKIQQEMELKGMHTIHYQIKHFKIVTFSPPNPLIA